jgi:glycerol kinase
MTGRYVVGLDQGTTSTRAIVYDSTGAECGRSQLEHTQHYPQPGWTEHDALEILANARRVLAGALEAAGIAAVDVAAVGIANQTETTVLWDRTTGVPVANAITWQDTRGDTVLASVRAAAGAALVERVERETMVELNDYFSATKIRWLLDEVPKAAELADEGRLAFGSMECWLTWNLTGGVDGGRHVTDVSNASRTLLFDMRRLRWSPSALELFGIPASILPEIVPTSTVVGAIAATEPGAGAPIAALMGDQQAATFGQCAFDVGEAKCTYGTGNFLIYNTGAEPRLSDNGLITTVVYQLEGGRPVYGLEGSVAVSGSLIQWLRDSLGLIQRADETETLARSVDDSGGVAVVPAFSGLYAPHWRRDVRGTIIGLTHHSSAAHIVRAALDSCAFQTLDLLKAAEADTGETLGSLQVDGGMTRNDLLMQYQADLLGVPVRRPGTTETTSLGVAWSAGLAVGVWSSLDALRATWVESARWEPARDDDWRRIELDRWHRALAAAFAAGDGEAEAV